MDWAEHEASLRYMLGELPLCRARLRVLRLCGHFTEMCDNPDELLWRMNGLPPHLEGLLLRGHPIRQIYPRLTRLSQVVRYVPVQYRQFFADMTIGYQDFLRRLPKDPVQDKRRRTRRYCEQNGGRLDLREYRRPSEMEEFYGHARAISSKTYQERLLNVGFPQGLEALSWLQQAAARDEVRTFLLFLRGLPVAYSYSTASNGILSLQYLGYDPQYRKMGVGAVLQFNIMERLFEEGRYSLYDYGQGEGGHKESLSTGSILCADIFYLRPRLKLQTLVRLHSGLDRFSALCGKWLGAVGAKALVRGILRKAA